jgi:acyl-CoA dehydrogenase
MTEERDDEFLFAQGPTKGLSGIQFHDFAAAYASVSLPNVDIFKEQIEVFKEFLIASASDPQAVAAQSKDIDFLLSMGEIFSLVAYGQLIIEYRNLESGDLSDDVLGQIFDFLVRDFSGFALQLFGKPSSTAAQQELCQRMIRRPAPDAARAARVFQEHVHAQKDAYEMTATP